MEPGDSNKAHEEDNQQCQAEHRATQVVEYLPAADGVHLVLDAFAALVAHLAAEPRDNLPVATSPAVVALGVVDIVRGVVVEHFHVVDEAAADVAAFKQVVAEDKVLGESAFQHLLEHSQVVDALATEGTFVEDVLVELETGCGVYVQSAKAGHKLGVAALVGYLHIDVHARLHDAVAAVHTASVGREHRLVQRVGHGADEFLGRVEHQFGVGVESDDELYGAVDGG